MTQTTPVRPRPLNDAQIALLDRLAIDVLGTPDAPVYDHLEDESLEITAEPLHALGDDLRITLRCGRTVVLDATAMTPHSESTPAARPSPVFLDELMRVSHELTRDLAICDGHTGSAEARRRVTYAAVGLFAHLGLQPTATTVNRTNNPVRHAMFGRPYTVLDLTLRPEELRARFTHEGQFVATLVYSPDHFSLDLV